MSYLLYSYYSTYYLYYPYSYNSTGEDLYSVLLYYSGWFQSDKYFTTSISFKEGHIESE